MGAVMMIAGFLSRRAEPRATGNNTFPAPADLA
jgi:hypothetical protein